MKSIQQANITASDEYAITIMNAILMPDIYASMIAVWTSGGNVERIWVAPVPMTAKAFRPGADTASFLMSVLTKPD